MITIGTYIIIIAFWIMLIWCHIFAIKNITEETLLSILLLLILIGVDFIIFGNIFNI